MHWLPTAALDEPICTISAAALRETTAIVTSLISYPSMSRDVAQSPTVT
jgi:hypothetical protein